MYLSGSRHDRVAWSCEWQGTQKKWSIEWLAEGKFCNLRLMLIRFSCLSFQRQACCIRIAHNELENLLHIKQLGRKVWDTDI